MNQFHLISLLIISFAIIENLFIGFCECHRSRRRVMWQQRTNIGDALNWVGDKIPCSSDSLLFPQQNYDLIKLSNFTMKQIILPKSGGFILDSQTSLNFREKDSKCTTNEVRSFKSVIESPWFLSSNWQMTRKAEEKNINFVNAATPHDERIPCDSDEVIFPINNSYVVDLQSMPSLTFTSIAIDGRVMSLSEFRDFLLTTFVGQSSFKNFENLQFIESECNDDSSSTTSCDVCHRKSHSLRQQLCENERPFCQPVPHCSEPIKPFGHCCEECGAMFQMKLTSINNFNLNAFESNIEKEINTATSTVDQNKIVYHISVTTGDDEREQNGEAGSRESDKNSQLYLQLIIVDRYEYNEHSTRLMEHLKQNILNDFYKNQSKFYAISGLPFTPNASGHVFTFIFGTFFFVTLFMTLIYIVYYDDRYIPRLMAMIRSRRFMHQSNVIFARFDNTSHINETAELNGGGGDGGCDDDGSSVVEVDLHFGMDQSIENVNRAFNNPMFEANIIQDKNGMRMNDEDDDDDDEDDDNNKIEEVEL